MTIHGARDAILSARSVVCLTGAGVSVESGIPDFRSGGGIWERFSVEDVGTREAFERDPERFWPRYLALVRALGEAAPNAAHLALARLEALGRLEAIVTQNVDGLHQAAGSGRVLEIHGSPDRIRCPGCGSRWAAPIARLEAPPRCASCGRIARPDVVLFGDPLPAETWAEALRLVESCDVLLVAGTSAVVPPAADLPRIAFERGATLCQFDVESTGLTHTGRVRWFVEGPVGETLPRLVSRIEAR